MRTKYRNDSPRPTAVKDERGVENGGNNTTKTNYYSAISKFLLVNHSQLQLLACLLVVDFGNRTENGTLYCKVWIDSASLLPDLFVVEASFYCKY